MKSYESSKKIKIKKSEIYRNLRAETSDLFRERCLCYTTEWVWKNVKIPNRWQQWSMKCVYEGNINSKSFSDWKKNHLQTKQSMLKPQIEKMNKKIRK